MAKLRILKSQGASSSEGGRGRFQNGKGGRWVQKQVLSEMTLSAQTLGWVPGLEPVPEQ